MEKKGKKVFVGLSGGVDSSVAAMLLLEQGYDVSGVFIKTWHPDFLPCTWKQERLDALRVAATLGIPFYTFDLEKEYKEGVAEYMIEEYKHGRTPNPDVMCNKHVKFGAFLKKSLSEGADFIATGHYARVVREEDIDDNRGTHSVLLKGVDTQKDQSYFLWTLTQEQLSRTLFPIGEYTKKEVRSKAETGKLPTAQKKDSQGVCFLGALDMREFLERYISPKRGDVLKESGEKIGHHDGAVYFTLGQRQGFTITEKGTHDLPYYVVGKDMEKNILTVSHEKKSRDVSSTRAVIENVNWINGNAPDPEATYSARFRYRQGLSACRVMSIDKKENYGINTVIPTIDVTVEFSSAQEPWAPGQSMVIYDDDRCLGGGVIR